MLEGDDINIAPAISPDGRYVAFLSSRALFAIDLYVADAETGEIVKRLRSASTDPHFDAIRFMNSAGAWSPDGTTLAFTTDRGPGGTNFETLTFGPERLALIDVASGKIETIRPFEQGMQHNPQFAPDGRSLFFIADADGFKDIYRMDLGTRAVHRVTMLQTGVSGFTALAPAMTVAAQSGQMMFSVFSGSRYTIAALESSETAGQPITPVSMTDSLTAAGYPIAGTLPPHAGLQESLVLSYLQDPSGLPTVDWTPPEPCKARLTLDYIAPPTVGVSFGGGFGSRLGGSVGFYFSDMLGNHNLAIEALANGTPRDIGGQITYLNRARRLNYGAAAGHILLLYGEAFYDIAEDPETGVVTRRYNEVLQRVYADEANALLFYPLQTTRRFELQTGLVRYGFDYRVERYYIYPNGGVRRDRENLSEPDPVYLSQSALAYVVDYSNFGFVSPIQGGRYRLQVGPILGSANYATVLGDVRRYIRAGQVTFAIRGLHIGNYGANQGDVFSSEYLDYSYALGFVRGYSFRSFDVSECTFSQEGSCPAFDRLEGTRIALASAEVRLSLIGTSQYGLIDFPYLPTELTLFTDSGLAWTNEEAPSLKWERRSDERVPVVSVGASTRLNVFGAIVMEVFYAYPFQRPDKGSHWGLQLVPGW